MQSIRILALSACIGAAVAGCGGGGSSTTTSAPVTASGTFTDSAVGGLQYTSGGQSGVTGANGSFTCEVGQSVTFTIGNLVLPTVTCAEGANLVTPSSLFATADLTDPQVVNLAQLLQTLDSNNDPSDGITLGAGVYTALTDISGVSFDDAGFDADAALSDFLTEAKGTPTTLVSGADATEHLQSQTIVGSWSTEATWIAGHHFTITFFTNGSFMVAEDGETDQDGQSGMERGTYTWNQTTGAFTASALVDTNGDWGTSHPLGATSIHISGNVMTFTDTVEGSGTFTRVASTSNPIVGAWYVINTGSDADVANSGDHATFTFFADGTYMEAEDDVLGTDAGQPGMERGTYTWNQTTGAFTANTLVDTNGTWGASDPSGATSLEIVGNTMTFTEGDITYTFARVVP